MDDAQPFAEWIGTTETVEDFIAAAPAQAAAAMLDDAERPLRRGLGAAAALALVLLPAEGTGLAHRAGRASAARRLPAANSVAAADVRGRAAELRGTAGDRPARPTRWRDPCRLAEDRPQRHARVRHRRLHHPSGRPGVRRGGAGHRLPRTGSASPGTAAGASAARAGGLASRVIEPDPVLLFRFSALTFNAPPHPLRPAVRDRREAIRGWWCTAPLTAVLLMELVRRDIGRASQAFSFRGQAPLFDLAPFRVMALPGADVVHSKHMGRTPVWRWARPPNCAEVNNEILRAAPDKLRRPVFATRHCRNCS